MVASYEPGERLAWCYVDETELPVPEQSCRSCVAEADSVGPKEPET